MLIVIAWQTEEEAISDQRRDVMSLHSQVECGTVKSKTERGMGPKRLRELVSG
jgi:hypothetical protein